LLKLLIALARRAELLLLLTGSARLSGRPTRLRPRNAALLKLLIALARRAELLLLLTGSARLSGTPTRLRARDAALLKLLIALARRAELLLLLTGSARLSGTSALLRPLAALLRPLAALLRPLAALLRPLAALRSLRTLRHLFTLVLIFRVVAALSNDDPAIGRTARHTPLRNCERRHQRAGEQYIAKVLEFTDSLEAFGQSSLPICGRTVYALWPL
jgi:hypothetical protein